MIDTTIPFEIVQKHPHSACLHTQGLFFYKDQLYESTGSPSFLPKTRSLFGKLCLETGTMHEYIELDRAVFYGEGSTILKNKIYYLTYKNRLCLVYDFHSHAPLTNFFLPTDQGWGLTNDGSNLIMSSGSHKLRYIDVDNFSTRKTIDVMHKAKPLANINDIQFVDGFVFANIYKTNLIAKIDVKSGSAEGFLDLTKIVSETKETSVTEIGVLNGIAYRSSTETFFVTGKFWPVIYELKLFC
ncbi:MAG: glutaminyl-peptide cyclotransferase [Wenzhouxiangella sp.]